ncbi:unnamed protein product, partial [Ectocarpus sp. 4 AP-2014]
RSHRSRGSSQSVRGSCSVAWKLACAAKKKHIFIKGSEERASEKDEPVLRTTGLPQRAVRSRAAVAVVSRT